MTRYQFFKYMVIFYGKIQAKKKDRFRFILNINPCSGMWCVVRPSYLKITTCVTECTCAPIVPHYLAKMDAVMFKVG